MQPAIARMARPPRTPPTIEPTGVGELLLLASLLGVNGAVGLLKIRELEDRTTEDATEVVAGTSVLPKASIAPVCSQTVASHTTSSFRQPKSVLVPKPPSSLRKVWHSGSHPEAEVLHLTVNIK